MHRHRKTLPFVCRQCTFSRASSSAAKPKLQPRSWALPADPSPTVSTSPQTPGIKSNVEKWAPRTSATQSKLSGTKWDVLSMLPSEQSKPSSAPATGTHASSPSPPGFKRSWSIADSNASQKTSVPSQNWTRILEKPKPATKPLASTPPPLESSPPTTLRSRNQTLDRDPLPHRGLTPAEKPYGQFVKPPPRQRETLPHTRKTEPSRPPETPADSTNKSNAGSQPDEYIAEAPEDVDKSLSRKKIRTFRTTKESRGSLVERMQHMPQAISQQGSDQESKKRAKKVGRFVEKKVQADVYIPTVVSVGQLAQLLDVRLEHLQHRMQQSGMAEEASYDYVLTSDYAVLLAEEFGRNAIVNDEMAFNIYPSPPHPDPSSLPLRPPVVTIMGHVDHGKTTLLDTLRSASVAKGEAGGITQHIGAFSVPVPSNGNNSGPRTITFLDTPGHAAFSAMRARGAGVTDIIVLVVAADDGIMPQTREVINLIKKDRGDVGVVVAINKVDKPGVDVEAVKKALLAEDIQLEDFGGDIPSVEVSGLTGQGLPNLVETLSAIAEMQDLRAEQDGPVHGYILESKMVKGLGPVATVLVLRGCLRPGSHIVSGVTSARVRVMNDSTGKSVKAANPGAAVTVSGWKTLPNAGEEVLQGSESDIKRAVANRQRKADLDVSLADVEAINATRRQERERREVELEQGQGGQQNKAEESDPGPKQLRLVVKADVSGSAEAVVGALQGIGNHIAITKVISSGVGDVTESDVTMAKTAGGMIIAFSVNVPKSIAIMAAQNNVEICSSNIIYRLMDTVKEHVIKLLPVTIEKKVTGEATILQIFEISVKSKQTMKVAGCRVSNGLVERSKQARVIRDGEIIHEGPLETLRQVKKDVSEVRKGAECGLSLANFSDVREGDLIQMFQVIEKPGVL